MPNPLTLLKGLPTIDSAVENLYKVLIQSPIWEKQIFKIVFLPLKYCVPFFESDVESDLEDGIVQPVIEVVRLKDVALRWRAAPGVLGQVDVCEPDFAEMPTSFFLL